MLSPRLSDLIETLSSAIRYKRGSNGHINRVTFHLGYEGSAAAKLWGHVDEAIPLMCTAFLNIDLIGAPGLVGWDMTTHVSHLSDLLDVRYVLVLKYVEQYNNERS